MLDFGLASDRVYHRLSLLKSGTAPQSLHFTLSVPKRKQRNIFCYTFRSLAAPSLSLVSSPLKSRLSSLSSSLNHTPNFEENRREETAMTCLPGKTLQRELWFF